MLIIKDFTLWLVDRLELSRFSRDWYRRCKHRHRSCKNSFVPSNSRKFPHCTTIPSEIFPVTLVPILVPILWIVSAKWLLVWLIWISSHHLSDQLQVFYQQTKSETLGLEMQMQHFLCCTSFTNVCRESTNLCLTKE